jgi:hypothetical protein
MIVENLRIRAESSMKCRTGPNRAQRANLVVFRTYLVTKTVTHPRWVEGASADYEATSRIVHGSRLALMLSMGFVARS